MLLDFERLPILPRDLKRPVGQDLKAHSAGWVIAIQPARRDERLEPTEMVHEEGEVNSTR